MSLTPTQKAFATSRDPFPAFVGGFGCMRADTPVATPSGFVGIADLRAGDDVLSWSEKDQQFQRAPTSGAFPKGKANLLRVITTQGEFVASEHHLVRVPGGTYRPLASLGAGDWLGTASQGLPTTSSVFGRIWLPEDDLRYWQTLADYLDGYGGTGRQCDPQLLRAVNNALASSQEQGDAHISAQRSSLSVSGRKDGLLGRIQIHSRPDRCDGRREKICLRRLFERLVEALEDQAQGLSAERIYRWTQLSEQFLGSFAARPIVRECDLLLQGLLPTFRAACRSLCLASANSSHELALAHKSGFFQQYQQCFEPFGCRQTERQFASGEQGLEQAYLCSTTETSIIHMERLNHEEWYWDMHVAGNNNYVTQDGSIHHNSGKTAAAIARTMALKSHFRQQDVAYYLPTYPLVEDIAFRRFPDLCDRKGWAYRLNKQSAYIEFPGAGRIIFRTMEQPHRIVGYEVAHSVLDELDTLPIEKARDVWNKVIARNRQKLPGGFPNTVAVATTPEGFRFVHERWVQNKAPGYVLFRARTMDNAANLPDGYIDNLRATYPSQLLSAYLDGEFVNLTAGSVYAEFDRKLNASAETIRENETLHVGMDFNVNHGAAAIHVLRGDEPHAVAEYTDVFDTPAMIALIKRDYPNHKVMIYPDASGASRKSNNASESDLSLLRVARFTVCANNRNPAVRDRILSMNKMIHNSGARRYRVNPQTCPQLVESLEKQAYTKHGEPDKSSGLDHIVDAAGYFISYKYPIVQRTGGIRRIGGLA